MKVLPVSDDYSVTAVYGQSGKLWKSTHKGIDFVTNDREVYSVTDGTVRVNVFDPSGWGNYISIGDSTGLRHIYCHLERSLVKEGDIIAIDIMANTINVKVSDEEMEARRKEWKPREPKVTTGYLARYASMVTSGNRGAILEIK